MSHARRASKRRGRAKAVTVLGVAGALSLVGGASEAAVGPPGDTSSTPPGAIKIEFMLNGILKAGKDLEKPRSGV